MTLRSKTILGIAIIEAIALGILIISGLNWLKTSNEKSLEVGSQQLASVFAQASRDAVIATDLAYLDSFAMSVVNEHNLAYIRISDNAGNLLTEQGAYINIDRNEAPFESSDGIYDVASPISLGGKPYGLVEMGVRIDGLQTALKYATQASIIIAIIEMSLAAIFSFALGTYLMRRLESLRKGVVEVTQKGPGAQIPITGNDEVTKVSEAFNQMSSSLSDAHGELEDQFESQRKLSDRVSLLAEVAEHARDVIIITDEAGDIIWVNKAFEKLTEYTLEEAKGHNPSNLLQGEETDLKTVETLSQSIRNKQPVRVEIQNYTKSKASYWVELDLSPVLDEDGNLLRFIAVERDISDRIEMENQLSQAVKDSKKASQAKSEFLANMSHEIRTPMNAIMGMSELLLERETRAEEKKLLELLHTSSGNLVTIINDILDYSKAFAGKLTLVSEPFDLRETVESCLRLCAYQANQKSLVLLLDYPLSLPSKVNGDKGRINQILLNLIGNAIKFTEHGHVVVSVNFEEGVFVFSIKDTGIGIPADRLPSIMDKFEQVDNSITRKYEGTGLGLAIAKQLVKLHGGEISVTSAEGVGSTFTFDLDLPVELDKAKPTVRTINKTLLLIDDYTPRVAVIEKIASEMGIKLSHQLSQDFNTRKHDETDVIIGTTTLKVEQLAELQVIGALAPSASLQQTESMKLIEQPLTHKCLQALVASDVAEEEKEDTKPDYDFSSLSVLVAEDSFMNRILLKEMLADTGINITMAEDGEIAVETYKQLKPDMVITDISMPNKDGYSVARDIRELQANYGYPWCPIIAFSAHALKEQQDKSHAAGMNDYITKPVQKAHLLESIAKWAWGQRDTG